MKSLRVCLLGFGEVGQMLAPDLLTRVRQLTAWDLKFADAAGVASHAAAQLGVFSPGVEHAIARADLVISAVTAAQSIAAARSVANHLPRAAYYLDLNSTSPAAKGEAAKIIAAAGGRFVEAAVMSPIAPHGAASPILLGGAHAAGFLPLATELGFTAAVVFSEKLGAAAAAKMCRSVIVKGLESLLMESLLTARRFGVEGAVLDSLQLLDLDEWRSRSRYMISRALTHGRRRAEEMREAAHTVAEAGFVPRMSGACADWQEWAAHHGALADHQLEKMLDAMLAAQRPVVARKAP